MDSALSESLEELLSAINSSDAIIAIIAGPPDTPPVVTGGLGPDFGQKKV